MSDAKLTKLMAEHQAAQHAMQSGVKQELYNELPGLAEPVARFLKHERVGINTALCDHSALVALLVAKGCFTQAEYFEAIRDEMRREVARYEERLSQMLGVKVVLG